MRLTELSAEKFQELRPFVDTLVLPVCSLGTATEGGPFAQDLLSVRQLANRVEDQLSGRVFMLPETVHTKLNNGEPNMPVHVLAEYLFHILQPFRVLGFDKAVLLYGSGTSGEAVNQAVVKLTEEGFQTLVLEAESHVSSPERAIERIVELWKVEK